mgnify:CR=1 FL=1
MLMTLGASDNLNSLSTRKSNIDLRYTEPYFLDKDLAAGFDLFNIRQNQKIYSGYKQNQIGFKLRAGYEIIDDLRMRFFIEVMRGHFCLHGFHFL